MNAIPNPSAATPTALAWAWQSICPTNPARGTAAFATVATNVLDGLCELEGTPRRQQRLARAALRFVECFDPNHDRALTLRAMKAVSVYLGAVEASPPRADLLGPGANWDEARALAGIQALANALLLGATWLDMEMTAASDF